MNTQEVSKASIITGAVWSLRGITCPNFENVSPISKMY